MVFVGVGGVVLVGVAVTVGGTVFVLVAVAVGGTVFVFVGVGVASSSTVMVPGSAVKSRLCGGTLLSTTSDCGAERSGVNSVPPRGALAAIWNVQVTRSPSLTVATGGVRSATKNRRRPSAGTKVETACVPEMRDATEQFSVPILKRVLSKSTSSPTPVTLP
jgi:hypothetical protein